MSFSFDASVRLGRFQYSAAFDGGDELVVLFGHSGAGKSITLQLFAGLLRPDAGRIVLHDRVLTDTGQRVQVPPEQRGVGYVVQELALFPHMTVAENVAFGIPGRADRGRRLAELLGLLSLEPYRDRRPGSLSGGQRQRVALARALARDAEILLLDEPFSALDESLRQGMRRELLRLRRELGLPIIFVTHDLREAHLLADRLAVFDEGKLLQYAPRDEVFRRPLSARVAELTGVANILPATVARRDGELLVVQCQGAELEAGPIPGGAAFVPGQSVQIAIRAERVNFRRIDPDENGGPNLLRAAIIEDLGYGSVHAIQLRPEGAGPALQAEIASRPYEILGLAAGGSWTIELPPSDIHVMPA